ncbi:hypothetical protein F5Y14DRAFT_449829 [Nemania sp. NC0429]|nr:hypothetical protein F5Y14DRAFT_449829 [Nemania sp. NC0429]
MADYISNNNDDDTSGDNPEGTTIFNRDEPQWPMSFAMTTPLSDKTPPRQWWRHDYYRNPQGRCVEVLYSKTKSESEDIARQFADEPVLGFDMEWPWDAEDRPKLQDRIALIQLASERKVGLFHISQHEGTTVDDFMAPTLRAILESPKIIKAGVAIINADFRRLRAFFNLEPKGAFELSHMHNLITYGAIDPRKATTRLRSLTSQVEQHLGLPLWKGSARTSDWAQPLSYTQTQYAATDAYAGFMLFHCMNAKRLAMDPAPPLPVCAETYAGVSGVRRSLRLESISEDGGVQIISVEDFYKMKNAEKERIAAGEKAGNEGGNDEGRPVVTEASKDGAQEPRVRNPKPRKDARAAKVHIEIKMDNSCWALYSRLASHRRQLASSQGITALKIAHNRLLQALAFHRPANEQELFLVPGVGRIKAAEYGPSWLEIIAAFKAEQKGEGGGHNMKQGDDENKNGNNNVEHIAAYSDIEQSVNNQAESGDALPVIQDHPSKRRRIVRVGRSKEILIPPSETPAVLSTGLSFHFGETSLADRTSTSPQPKKQGNAQPDFNFDVDADFDADDFDSVFGPPMEIPSPSTLKRKRDIVAPTDHIYQRDRSAGFARMPIPIPRALTPVKLEPPREVIIIADSEPQQPALSAPTSVPALPFPSCLASTASRAYTQAPPENTGLEKVILRNKLEAYVKSVVWAMHPKPIEPLVSEATLQYLITAIPRTVDEFRRAPDIQRLVEACEIVKMDVWRTFEKWTRNLGVVAGVGSSG